MAKYILVLNTGSSTVKYTLFQIGSEFKDVLNGLIEYKPGDTDHIEKIATEIDEKLGDSFKGNLEAIGHRVVHGGKIFHSPAVITEQVLLRLKSLIPLAPLHQPQAICTIELCSEVFPDIKQVACFDTMFHMTQKDIETMFAIPHKFFDEGVLRYGFHGLSYEYISKKLFEILGEEAKSRVIVAHLGNGSSLCAMKNLKSVATTMGFTALDGLMMGTRCGNIDPGVILYLLENGMDYHQVSNLLYKESGLKGVSGISNDIRTLLQDGSKEAYEAIELFCYKAAKALGGVSVPIGGVDIIVFTAGIGTNSHVVRDGICKYLKGFGVVIDEQKNQQNSFEISAEDSKVKVLVIKTDEERVIANHILNMV